MYVPILNSKEKARELVDVVREQTDAPIGVCINTVSIILSALLRDLPDIYGLRVIKSALEKDYIIDVENCHDARVLEQVIVSLTSYIEDKGQKKADVGVLMKRFRRDDYIFIEQLVSLYQIELKKSVRIELLTTFHSLCLLDRSVITILLCGQLPVLLVLQNNFSLPLTELDILSLQLLSVLFSTGEKFPTSHYDALNLEFLTKIVSIVKDCTDAFQFILSFNSHFESNENTVIQTLHKNAPVTFGQLLTIQLNRCRADNKDDLISVLFYDNDLKVLYGILCQDLIDTNQSQKMAMILQIMKNMEVIRRCEFTQEVYTSVKSFLLTRETQVELRHSAESLLQRVTEQQRNLPFPL